MKRLTLLATGAAMLFATVGPAVAAQAADGPAAAPRAAAAEDGRLHAWVDPNQRGAHCSWSGNKRDWDYGDDGVTGNCEPMRNRASSLENRGFGGGYDDVDLYYNQDQSGVYACLGHGDAWYDLTGGDYIFNFGLPWWSGKNESVNDNISSHSWTDSC
ncbi:peptidase inhibitor family I36 protein [Streptomyces lincolnensis]|jgi:hypothetical protein|uniref:peptidase inhibitor family I36 protein n=1 Tax=Streptomyces TaxID=1883 RepID=UPI001E53560F|nr:MULTISPECIES: peptidase inhibitor family I36 protein [Streptomyces]MCD7441366.1 peptidase inhibitor family I36 protein [Streptomyces lincolnensis]WLW54186.1 peptidase inhibitor family I36 protein [Streptomyces coralus]